MTGRRLILKDGTEIEGGVAGLSDGSLWLYLTGFTMPELATMFCDPAKTGAIVAQFGQMQDEHTGFTVCTIIKVDADGKASVCLTRGE